MEVEQGTACFQAGGGGSNYNQGGDGGRQSASCVSDNLIRAWGGLACKSLYINYGRDYHGRWRWQRSSESADLKYSHQWWQWRWHYFHYYRYPCRKKREDSYQPTGKVLLHLPQAVREAEAQQEQLYWMLQIITGAISVKIHGGNGGKGNPTICTGSGGGGSGGVFWHSGNAITGATVAVDSTGGGYRTLPVLRIYGAMVELMASS